jgi:hypothetical protein
VLSVWHPSEQLIGNSYLNYEVESISSTKCRLYRQDPIFKANLRLSHLRSSQPQHCGLLAAIPCKLKDELCISYLHKSSACPWLVCNLSDSSKIMVYLLQSYSSVEPD